MINSNLIEDLPKLLDLRIRQSQPRTRDPDLNELTPLSIPGPLVRGYGQMSDAVR